MKFIKSFTDARNVSAPLVKVNTSDAANTILTIRESLGTPTEQEGTPLVAWDAINGLHGENDSGNDAVRHMLTQHEIASTATVELPIALAVLNGVQADLIVFIHNVHLFWEDPLVIQGIWNLRDSYKANGMMMVMFASLGTILPPELNNDVLSLEEPLPNRAEIRNIGKSMYKYAGCTDPSAEVYEQLSDALIGVASFPAEQAIAMNLDKNTGILNIKGLWDRKREIIKAVQGLSFSSGLLTLLDLGGCNNIRKYMSAIMKGKRRPRLILRVDEIEKAFAGAGTDTSGVKGDLLGNFLSWVEDKNVFCVLLLGVPGAAKSHFIYCLGGSFGVPVVNFDIAGMQDSLVGNSGKNLRRAEATVEAISDGDIMLIATANSLRGLPAELLSRFEKGGIFFFDTPNAEERMDIMTLKLKKYNIDPSQEIPDTTGWTGREIESLCDKTDRLEGGTLTESAKYVVPLTKSQASTIDDLRQSANERYLSANHEGLYHYKAPETTHTSTVTQGRKMR